MKTDKKQLVYILHGWSVDPRNEEKWELFRAALEEKGVASHFLGLPGLSSPLNEVWDLQDYVNWLEQQLPEEPVILLGHSFGGQISVRFAAQHPDRVARLILIASSGIRDKRWQARFKRTVFFVLAKVGKIFSSFPFARRILYKVAREKDYFEAPLHQRQTMTNVIQEEIIEDFQKVQAPTLLIWGEQDTATPLRNTEYFKKIKDAQLHTIPAARHSPQFTHSEQTAQLVATFILENS